MPGHLTGPRYLIFLNKFCQSYWTEHTLPLRLVLPCGSSKMEPPHISVFLFGITWMQYVVNDGLAVEVQCIDFSDRQTFPVWIISSGSNEIVGVRNTRKQRQGELVARISAAAGEIRNTQKCYRMFDAPRSEDVKPASHATGVSSNTSFDSSFSFFSLLFLL
ncbi:hypothetical protein TNCV_5123101 [Trichonephila clavipes]|nr:hypothetical protein TNCV_5123101 [Trichonephila clavipes]